jgi:hypothetical protein
MIYLYFLFLKKNKKRKLLKMNEKTSKNTLSKDLKCIGDKIEYFKFLSLLFFII